MGFRRSSKQKCVPAPRDNLTTVAGVPLHNPRTPDSANTDLKVAAVDWNLPWMASACIRVLMTSNGCSTSGTVRGKLNWPHAAHALTK